MSRRQRRVLLGQLSANGDCVYATTVARQIKADDPTCHLTWAIGSTCRHVIDHNPDVDEVWEVPLTGRSELRETWNRFEREALERQRRGDFHDVHLTQIYPNNYGNYDGTVRASIFRGYPRPITVPVIPVLRLGEDEVARTEAFARGHDLIGKGPVVLFECAALSGQSFVTPPWALEVAERIVNDVPGSRVVLSSATPVETGHPAIIDGSVLTFRENAALTRYCSLLLGCSSGISWLCTSDAATPLPTIQFLSRRTGMYGAMVHDLEHWGLPSGHVIEMLDCSAERGARGAVDALVEGVATAGLRHHEPRPLTLEAYYETMLYLLRQGEVRSVVESMGHTFARYAPQPELITDLWRTLAIAVGNAARKRWHRWV